MSPLLGVLVVALQAQLPSDVAYEQAAAHLEAGQYAEAETSARKALALSLAFEPQKEIASRPDKGLLFEDMILEARRSYGARRARYFRALGDALAGQEAWRAARKAYRRSVAIVPDDEVFLLMADHDDLAVGEKVDFLLSAYLAAEAGRDALESRLLETGVFRSRNALKASLDRRRFSELKSAFPDLELAPGAFPNTRLETTGGTLVTAELFEAGTLLLVYVPVEACARCTEELDGIIVPAMETPLLVSLNAFVPEADLPIARRIVRLLGIPVGVGRRDALPSSLSFLDDGEMRFVARGGLTQIRVPMTSTIRSSEIRERAEAIFSFLTAPGLPTEREPEEASVPLVKLERGVNEHRTLFEWADQIARAEIGPAPVSDLYNRLTRLTQRVVRGEGAGRELGFEILEALSPLEGANAAKTRALVLAGDRLGDRLLAEAQRIEGAVRRTAPGEMGVFHLAVTGSPDDGYGLYLQRSFQTQDGVTHINFVLKEDNGDLAIEWADEELDEPRGVAALPEGAVFRFARDGDCRGLRVVAGGAVIYESCYAVLLGEDVVEVRSALVDETEGGPRFYRYGVLDSPEETALERGLRLFSEGDFAGAAAAFAEARKNVDPAAPYDESDLVYNRARALEELGKRTQALELYRSLGDVSYQELVDEGAGRIEGAK